MLNELGLCNSQAARNIRRRLADCQVRNAAGSAVGMRISFRQRVSGRHRFPIAPARFYPGGIPAISRGLSGATPPDTDANHSDPAGVAGSEQRDLCRIPIPPPGVHSLLRPKARNVKAWPGAVCRVVAKRRRERSVPPCVFGGSHAHFSLLSLFSAKKLRTEVIERMEGLPFFHQVCDNWALCITSEEKKPIRRTPRRGP